MLNVERWNVEDVVAKERIVGHSCPGPGHAGRLPTCHVSRQTTRLTFFLAGKSPEEHHSYSMRAYSKSFLWVNDSQSAFYIGVRDTRTRALYLALWIYLSRALIKMPISMPPSWILTGIFLQLGLEVSLLYFMKIHSRITLGFHLG